MAGDILSAQRLRVLLDYDPDTGLFTWRAPLSNVVRVGQVAGTRDSCGYIAIGVDGRRCLAHRLAWLHYYGEHAPPWPQCQIDHINRIKTDNRIANLRLVSPSGNKQNRVEPHSNNRIGKLGVKRNGKSSYMAQIWVDGRSLYLGTYKCPELAEAAYLKAKAEYHTEGTT